MGPYLNPSEVVGIIYKHLTRRGDEGLPVTVPVPSLDNNELGPPLRPVCAILYPKIYPLDWTHPNYGDASYVPFDDGWVLFSISIVTCIMLGIAVITRLVTRHLFAGRLGPDDWMIVVALVLAIGNTIINCRGVVVGGLGLYMHDMTLTHFIHAYKVRDLS